MTLGSVILLALCSFSPALAQDPGDEFDIDDLGDDFEFEDEDEGEDKDKDDKKDKDEESSETVGDPAEEEEPPPPMMMEDELLDEEFDLLGDEEEAVPDGGDTSAEFRAEEARLAKLPPDMELAGWEKYLRQYPNTVYRERIELRMDQLVDATYEESIGKLEEADAMNQEINFAQAVLLENIDPRSRLQAAFEWGFPGYGNIVLDGEGQITRKFSLHAGVRRRFQSLGVEFGPRWAIVKSTRTRTLLTLMVDARISTDPFFPAVRPQLAFGKRWGKTDVQLHAGTDIEFREDDRGSFGPELRVIGGGSIFYLVTERVGLFAESAVLVKPVPGNGELFAGGTFRFNTITLGLKFFPQLKNRPDERPFEINVGGSAPFASNWWQFHAGSFAGQFNYYL